MRGAFRKGGAPLALRPPWRPVPRHPGADVAPRSSGAVAPRFRAPFAPSRLPSGRPVGAVSPSPRRPFLPGAFLAPWRPVAPSRAPSLRLAIRAPWRPVSGRRGHVPGRPPWRRGAPRLGAPSRLPAPSAVAPSAVPGRRRPFRAPSRRRFDATCRRRLSLSCGAPRGGVWGVENRRGGGCPVFWVKKYAELLSGRFSRQPLA